MKTMKAAAIMLCVMAPMIAFSQQMEMAQGAAGSKEAPKTPLASVAVDWEFASGATTNAVVIRIRNVSQGEIQVEHPGNRMAFAFVVLNELGNVVQPEGVAKVDPIRHPKISLKAGEVFEQILPETELANKVNASFPFLTGSALFAYELKKEATYRITAIYRPNGQTGDGIASPEHIVTIK